MLPPGKIGFLLNGISMLVFCAVWAIYNDWRLGLVSLALLPALVVGMVIQVFLVGVNNIADLIVSDQTDDD